MATPSKRDFAHSQGKNIDSVCNADFDLYPPAVQQSDLRLRNMTCQLIAGTTTTGATAYFVYLGRTNRRLSAQKVLFRVTTGGASTQAGEVGVFSSPVAPNGAAQTLTKIVATGTLDDLTGTGTLGNTTAFNKTIPAGTHIWAGYRVDMASTEPTVIGLTGDESNGAVLSLGSATAFTSGTTYAGALITAALTWQAPNLVLTCT